MPKAKYSLEARQTSGIYAIVNLVNGYMYIGQTAFRFSERWSNHCCDLNQGTHGNRLLQEDWKTYGPDAFEFRILESRRLGLDPPMDYLIVEQRYIAAANVPLYNKFRDR